MKKLFVGSLAWATDDAGLEEFFSQFGTVASAKVVTDRETNRSRGFAFVEFENDSEADKAIAEADGKDLDGRAITVNEAKPREDKPRRDFGGNRNGGFNRR